MSLQKEKVSCKLFTFSLVAPCIHVLLKFTTLSYHLEGVLPLIKGLFGIASEAIVEKIYLEFIG